MDVNEDKNAEQLKTSDSKLRKGVSILTWIIIFFVPTYGFTITRSSQEAQIEETIYMLPWIIVIHHLPQSNYVSDQFSIISFPWSFVLFLPFFYIAQQSLELYRSDKKQTENAMYILIAAIIQLGILNMTFKSQEIGITEEVTTRFIPQLLIIVIYLLLTVIWYSQKVNQTLKPAKS